MRKSIYHQASKPTCSQAIFVVCKKNKVCETKTQSLLTEKCRRALIEDVMRLDAKKSAKCDLVILLHPSHQFSTTTTKRKVKFLKNHWMRMQATQWPKAECHILHGKLKWKTILHLDHFLTKFAPYHRFQKHALANKLMEFSVLLKVTMVFF